jgi:hypothetical protein
MNTKQLDKIYVKFEGIDNFNCPIFYDGKNRHYYGASDELFCHDATEAEVKCKIKASDLSFFGYKFNCEPYGFEPRGKIIIL